MAVSVSSGSGTCSTLLEMYSCIMDYACRHRHMDVIYEVCRRHKESLASLAVPHSRLACASLYKMVSTNTVSEYSTALLLAEQLFLTAESSNNCSLVRCYAKLLCGLKVKSLFHCLQSSPKQAFILLRKYFPRTGDSFDKQLASMDPSLAEEIRKASQDFRKSFLPLIGHEGRRESFMKTQYENLYGQYFAECLTKRVTKFLDELEKHLPDSFLDELLETGGRASSPTSTQTLVSDIMLEMLLDCVEGKSALQSSDLLNLLDDLCPLTPPSEPPSLHSSMRVCLTSSFEDQSVSNDNTDSLYSESAVVDITSSDQDEFVHRLSEGGMNSSSEFWSSADFHPRRVYRNANLPFSQEKRITRSRSRLVGI